MRIVTFADGFTSASAPDLSTAGQERYDIDNNQTINTEITGFSVSGYTSVFAAFELERMDVNNTYRQTGEAIISVIDGEFILNLGNWQGDDLIRSAGESISLGKEIILGVNAATGQMYYQSGLMGASYTGELKIEITGIL